MRRPVERDLADAARLGREQHALGVEAVEDVAEALVLGADETPALDRQPVVGDLARRDRVAPDLRDRPDVDVVGIEVGEEEAEAAQAAVLVAGAGEEQDHLGLECLRRPDLAAGDPPAALAVGLGAGGDPAGVGAGVGLGHPERDVEVARGGAGEELRLEPVVAELGDGIEPEDREVQRGAAVHRRAARGDFVQHDRGVGDPASAAAVLLGQRDADPAAFGHPRVEVPRELVLAVAARPVVVVETRTDAADRLRDQPLIVVEELVVSVGHERERTGSGHARCRAHRDSQRPGS